MVAMFHVAGSLLYLDKDENIVGFDDVFTKLEKAKAWYTECGLGADFVMQFVRQQLLLFTINTDEMQLV